MQNQFLFYLLSSTNHFFYFPTFNFIKRKNPDERLGKEVRWVARKPSRVTEKVSLDESFTSQLS